MELSLTTPNIIDIYFFIFLHLQVKLLDAMFPDGQYPADAVSEMQARLRRTLDVLLERARQPIRPQELAALDAQLEQAGYRLRDLERQLRQALANSQAHAETAEKAERQVRLDERRAALAADQAKVAEAAAAAAAADEAATAERGEATKASRAETRAAAKAAAREAARLERRAKPSRTALAKKRADRDRNARRAAELPRNIADAKAALEALRRRIAERDGGGKDGASGAAAERAEGGTERGRSAQEHPRAAREVGRSRDGALASTEPGDLLRPVKLAGDDARGMWRAVATFGPAMLLDSTGLRIGPHRELQRSWVRLDIPAAPRAGFAIRH
jgi:hypothetical protein